MIRRWISVGVALAAAGAAPASAQQAVEYVVRVRDPGRRVYEVEARLPAAGDTTYVSLPVWTPGHYELENYARYVRRFRALDGGGSPLRWDKLDPDTWRIFSHGARTVRVVFEFWADTVNLSGSLLRDDFGFFNGTNLFVYPEGRYDFPARVRLELPEGWRVATELDDTDEPGVFAARDYHDLVDNPTFLGHFAIDSVSVDGRWVRMAVYPAVDFAGNVRTMAMTALARIARAIHRIFGGPAYDHRYTVLVYLDAERSGGSGGLEHTDSHLDILPEGVFRSAQFTFFQFLYPLLAHEYFHAWNVKRIRPQALWPYRYDRPQYTPLLWVSEGITDYYAHVVLARAGLWSGDEFLGAVRRWVSGTESQPARVAVEDASIDTWIAPTFVSRYVYYDAGALLGLMLDIEIRHATRNRHSLDDVMVRLYREHYERGRGFATEDFVRYVGEYIGRAEARRFYRDYVDGRRPYPYAETFAAAGLTYAADTIVEPFLGVQAVPSREGPGLVRYVVHGGTAAAAGLRPGDRLVKVGVVEVTDRGWADAFVRAYADSIGRPVTLTYRRGGAEISRTAVLGSRTRYRHRIERAEDASPAALAVWRGIVGGRARRGGAGPGS